MIIGIQKHMHRSVYIYPTWYGLCLQTRWFEGKFVFSVCDKKCRIGKKHQSNYFAVGPSSWDFLAESPSQCDADNDIRVYHLDSYQ